MLNLPDHEIIPAARQVVQICLEEIEAEGRLRDVATRQDDFVGQLSYGLLADFVRVFNVGGYIGASTRREIEYAQRLGKPIVYLEVQEVCP